MGDADGVWVLDVTRFSRKVIEGERLVEIAQGGRSVWSYSGGYNLATADGRKTFRDAMVTAAAESDKISERTKRGKRRKATRAAWRGHVGRRKLSLAVQRHDRVSASSRSGLSLH